MEVVMKLDELMPAVRDELAVVKQDLEICEAMSKIDRSKPNYDFYDFRKCVDFERAVQTSQQLLGADDEGMANIIGRKRREFELISRSQECILSGSHFELGLFPEREVVVNSGTAVEVIERIRAMKSRMPYQEMSIGLTRNRDYGVVRNIFTIDSETIDGVEISVIVPWASVNGMKWIQFPLMYSIIDVHGDIGPDLTRLHSMSKKMPLALGVSQTVTSTEFDNDRKGKVDIEHGKMDWRIMDSYCVYTGKIKMHARKYKQSEADVRMEHHNDMRVFVESTILPFLYLLNTRGISTRSVDPPERVNRKRIKQGKPPLQTYKILKFDIPKGATNSESNDGTSIKKRLHTCLGHTRFYTAEKPLFGTYVGPVWIPPHIRGNKDLGSITKDYQKK